MASGFGVWNIVNIIVTNLMGMEAMRVMERVCRLLYKHHKSAKCSEG
jgi:hypothetical protein